MTSYSGGKQRIAKHISNIIIDETDGLGCVGYIEPFAGMLSVFSKIYYNYDNDLTYQIGDLNKNITDFWTECTNGFIPPNTITEEQYNFFKDDKDSPLKTFIGYQYGFAGGYYQGYTGKYGKSNDSTSAVERIKRISQQLRDSKAIISHGNYTQYNDVKNHIIYCDIPYENTKCKFKCKFNVEKFNHGIFWQWARIMSKKNKVFISSYNAPDDFEVIWENTSKLTGKQGKNKTRTERLFILRKFD